jgi:hypothetical protein
LARSGSIINAGDLAVGDGQSLTLLGGNVINTGQMSAPGGRITLAAVPGENLVRISQAGQLLSLEVAPPRESGGQLAVNPLALPTLLTGSAEGVETGLRVQPDGGVRLMHSGAIVPTEGGNAIASGTLNAAGEMGGEVNLLGDRVGLFSGNIKVYCGASN